MKRTLFILLSILLLPVLAYPQIKMEIAGNVELVPNDTDARNFMATDDNDDRCALLKVKVTNPLKSTLVIDTKGSLNPVASPTGSNEQPNGEWWFWLSPRVTNIKFMCKGYDETKYIGVSLAESRVYRVTLNIESIQQTVDIFKGNFGTFKLSINPSDVLVFYGPTNACEFGPKIVNDGYFSDIFTQGTYYYRIENEYYETATGRYIVNETDHEEVITLKPQFGQLSISSIPDGVNIFLDGKPIGVTPISSTERLKPGKHSIRFIKDDFYPVIQEINVVGNGRIQSVPTVQLRPQFGIVTCICDDSEAEITITSPTGAIVAKGHNGMKAVLNSAYTYKVEASKPSHTSQSLGIIGTSIEGKEETISVGAPIPIFGSLQVKTSPAKASVSIDNVPVGTTPLVQNQLLIGKHVVSISLDGYNTITKSITIQEKQNLLIDEELSVVKKETIVSRNSSSITSVKHIPNNITPTRINSKDVTLKVGDIITAYLPEGRVSKWELNLKDYAKNVLIEDNRLMAIRPGRVTVWGYIGNKPKLFYISIREEDYSSYNSSNNESVSHASPQKNTTGLIPHTLPTRNVTSKDFSMKVGEVVTVSLPEGEITSWEVSSKEYERYIVNDGNRLMAIKPGKVWVWGYLNNGPNCKKIDITIK